MSNAPTFGKRGAEAVKPAGSFDTGRTKFFSIPDGSTAILRFLTDYQSWPQFLQHQNIPTKEQPEGFKGSWPKNMPAPCRKDPQFGNVHSDCYICDVISQTMDKYKKPSQRYWALACVREEVKEDGRLVGYRDATVEVTRKDEKTGEEVTTKEKDIVVLNMGWKNFFSTLDGYGSGYGTVLDRDYKIIRKGEKLETTYTILPLDPIPGLDVRDPEIAARYLPKAKELGTEGASDDRLGEIIGERASDEFYGTFFDARVTAKANGGGTGGNTAPAPEAAPVASPETDLAPEKVANLMERIQGYTAPSAEEPVAAGGVRDFG